MKLTIYASDLAACVGMHRYQQPWEAALRIFERTSPSLHRSAYERVGMAIPVSVASRTLQKIHEGDVLTKVDDLIQGPVEMLDDNIQKIVDGMSISEPEFANDLKTYVFTERGKAGEKEVIDDFERTNNVVLSERNSKFFKKIFPCDGNVVTLGGRVDGLSEDGRLVEVKNRQRHFFNQIPVYERIQVTAYMVLTERPQCELVERYAGQSRVTMVTFDEVFWEKVLSRMLDFAKKMFVMLDDEAAQERLITERDF